MTVLTDFLDDLELKFPDVELNPILNRKHNFPSITYSVRDGVREAFYRESFGLRSTKITLNLYSKSYGEVQGMKDTLINNYHGFSGTLGSSVLTRITVFNSIDTEEKDAEDTLFRSIIELDLLD